MDQIEYGVIEIFLKEIMGYRQDLEKAVSEILGADSGREVLRRLEALEAVGSYVADPEPMQQMGAFFVGNEEDLGFYVATTFEEGIQFQVTDRGRVDPAGMLLNCRPFFLYWPQAIRHCASRMASYDLPLYFTPWLHEFGHFLCYCLQSHPIAVSVVFLSDGLNHRGIPLRGLNDLDQIGMEAKGSVVWDMARSLVQLAAIHEAMAIWWEKELLRIMKFDIGDYLAAKERNNPYLTQLEKFSKETTLQYIRQWDLPRFYKEVFTREFVNSFAALKIEKWSFMEGGKT